MVKRMSEVAYLKAGAECYQSEGANLHLKGVDLESLYKAKVSRR